MVAILYGNSGITKNVVVKMPSVANINLFMLHINRLLIVILISRKRFFVFFSVLILQFLDFYILS